MDTQIVQDIESSAEWRGRKAEEYPDDARNAQSAAALELAAREVAALPDDDPRLVRLESVEDEDTIEHYVEVKDLIIGRHGFGPGATQTTDELLAALVREVDVSEAWSEKKTGPVEVWLRLGDAGFGISGKLVFEDESVDEDVEVEELSIRGAERGITGWLLSEGYKPVGRWETWAEGQDGADLEVSRKFAPTEGAKPLR